MAGWTERTIVVAGVELAVLEAGRGAPLLVLHDELGPGDWLDWHANLALERRLIMPVIPGFRSARVSWITGVRHIAALFGGLLRDLAPGGVDVIGLSFGGWVAAEMAVQNSAQFSRMILVAPFGLKAPEGAIADMFLMSSAEYIRAGFSKPDEVAEFARIYGNPGPDAIEAWEDARIECAQLGWQPYMHEPAMEPLLPLAGRLPSLVIWGEDDAVVPRSVAQAYAGRFQAPNSW